MTYLATFFTHSGAIKFEKYLNESNIKNTLMPVPRKLSSSCGVASKFDYADDVKVIISHDIHQLYQVDGRDYVLLYDAD